MNAEISPEELGLSEKEIQAENLFINAKENSFALEEKKEIPETRIAIDKEILPQIFEKYNFDPASFSKENIVSVNDEKFDSQRIIDVVWNIDGPKNVFLRRTITYKEEALSEGKMVKIRREEWFLDFRLEEDSLKTQKEQALSIDKYFAEHEKEKSVYGFNVADLEELSRRYAPRGHEEEYSYLKVYPESFGDDVVEPMAIRALKTLPFVEEIEPATHNENQDQNKQVDFWIKIKGMEKPFGIQFTVTKEPETLNKKFGALVKERRMVAKTDFPDSKVKGNEELLPVILVNVDGLPYSKALKKWQEIDDYAPQIPFDGRLLPVEARLEIIKRILENASQKFPLLAAELAKILPAYKNAKIPELSRREIEPAA